MSGTFVRLSDESLQRPPEEVFDLLEKLGEGSYGAVYKAMHKESGELLAIKKVPVDTDLQEIIKEISIMQQCDSAFVVKYYGSYFKDQDLWIVMEYCGAGSVSDIMRACRKTLQEDQIATILQATLKGLEYLHFKRKIHRDIKAGNILLNCDGHAKLADFGVAGQLTDTMAKRNTVIGTPFWMAPEVIQEVGYDCRADIWSIGITAVEMAEGKPPYADIHPMRAIFMIPSKPPPTFKDTTKWSENLQDFLSQCVVKNPEERATATSLLQHLFIKAAKPPSTLRSLIEEAMALMREPHVESETEEEPEDTGTMITTASSGTSNSGTMISAADTGTMVISESPVGTMVVNDADSDGTVKFQSDMNDPDMKTVYRPAFMDHFDKVGNLPEDEVARPGSLTTVGDDIEHLGKLTCAELKQRLASLDPEMEREIEELRRRYLSKRQPILDAMEAKRRRQGAQDFVR